MIQLQVFEVGDRIRVRVNAECRYCVDHRYPACEAKALAEDGRTGTVAEIGHASCGPSCVDELDLSYEEHMAHNIWVKWDERRAYDDPPVVIAALPGWEVPFDNHFAPQELELVEETTDHRIETGGRREG